MPLDAAALAHAPSHHFDSGNPVAERNTRRAMWLTAATMLVEIVGGWWYNSMAVLADGWHMSSHTLALGLSLFAYVYARRHARDSRFAFGTWKVEVLGGYSSAILLLVIAALMVIESVERLLTPAAIAYDQALAIAIGGLAVNLVCAWLLRDQHGHDHGHGHGHGHSHDHPGHSHDHDHAHDDAGHDHKHDLNLRAAYVHVLTDAATSVLAIVALIAGKLWGADWLDPVMGLAGAVLVSVWAIGLLRDSGRVLLDAEMDAPIVAEVRETIEHGDAPARIADLHVWRVGRRHYACIVGIVTTADIAAEHFRSALAAHAELAHITVEVTRIAATPEAVAASPADRP